MRIVIGGALIAILSLGGWIGLHLFFQVPPTDTFTLPPIPDAPDTISPAPPADDPLLTRADELFEEGATVEAWEKMARSGRLDDPRFTSRLMRFGLAAARADETLVVLNASDPELDDWSAGEWLLLIQLHEATGQINRALEIAERRLSDHSELDRLRALKHNSSGSSEDAAGIVP